MSIPAEQVETAAFLRRLAEAEPVETHISLVFVGADTVWKVKKAVRLSFLDFTSLDSRRHFAERELTLNAPSAPGLYRDVVAVTRQADGTLALGGPPNAPVVEWVLRMGRVPAGAFLDVMAAEGRLDPPLLDALTDAVAAAHGALPPATGVVPDMHRVALVNARAARDANLPEVQVAAWEAAMLAALDTRSGWVAERAATGFVRRAHGDLHLGNLCLWQGQPVLFDALEFDEALATGDLGYDLAFLLMDLDLRVNRSAANRVLNRYVARTGDVGLVHGLSIFLSMRAMIRAHVQARMVHDDAARLYLDTARSYLNPGTPVVVAIGGLPGTGKSTLARVLAPCIGAAPGALVLRSDEIRKRRFGVAAEQRLPEAAYAPDVSLAVFNDLAAMVVTAATSGHAVIADATFMDPQHRAMIETAAVRAGVPFMGFWLHAPLPVLEARVASRVGDASDATLQVLRSAAQNDPGPGGWRLIDATHAGRARPLARQGLESHIAFRVERRAELQDEGSNPTGADHGYS